MPDDVLPELVSLAEARARGLKRYFTGRPCPQGHIAERSVNGRSACLQCVQEWDKSHPESARRRSAKHRKTHPKPRIAGTPQDPRRRKRASQPRHVTRAEYYQKHRDKLKALNIAWGKTHREARRESVAYRRARERKPIWVSRKALLLVYLECPPEHHIDHIVPLGGKRRTARTAEGYPISGLHVPWNLHPLPGHENIRKLFRMRPEEQALCESPFNPAVLIAATMAITI